MVIVTKTQKERYNRFITEKYKDELDSFSDLLGDGCSQMSNLFYLINRRFLHWIDNDPDIAVSKDEILHRRRIYEIIKRIGPGMLKCTQVFEDRGLLDGTGQKYEDIRTHLPDNPVIFVSNHGFHDDALATVLAANRHGYFLNGSLPMTFNTFDGFATSLIGGIVIDRKSKSSRASTIPKAKRAMEYGADMIFFPEGGWNKSKELLSLELWKGVYALSREMKCMVVPIVHYVRNMEVLDKKEIIHTVVDTPVPLYGMGEDEGMQYLRDVFATWTWRMAERYGQSTRAEEMKGFESSDAKWHHHLKERMKGVARYDSSIEKRADYRPAKISRPESVFEAIAGIKSITAANIMMKLYARNLVDERRQSDFQRLY